MNPRRLVLAMSVILVAPATAIVAEERSVDLNPRAYVWTEESMKRDRELKISDGSHVVFLLVLVLCLGIAAWVIGQLLDRRPTRRIRRRVSRRDEFYY